LKNNRLTQADGQSLITGANIIWSKLTRFKTKEQNHIDDLTLQKLRHITKLVSIKTDEYSNYNEILKEVINKACKKQY